MGSSYSFSSITSALRADQSLAGSIRSDTGRIVIVSSDASIKQAPAEGIMSTISTSALL